MSYYIFAGLLQPVTATTPLAAVLNRWMVALAPAAALINSNYPSAARQHLQDASAGAHFYHRTVSKIIERLEAGKDLRSLWPVMRWRRDRASVAEPVLGAKATFALAMRGAELTDAKQVHKYVAYSDAHHDQLIAQGGPFAADCALLAALFAGGARAMRELDNEVDEARGQADALAILRCVLDADAKGLAECIAYIERRDGHDEWSLVHRRRKSPHKAVAHEITTCKFV
jgi:hypothetical protein